MWLSLLSSSLCFWAAAETSCMLAAAPSASSKIAVGVGATCAMGPAALGLSPLSCRVGVSLASAILAHLRTSFVAASNRSLKTMSICPGMSGGTISSSPSASCGRTSSPFASLLQLLALHALALAKASSLSPSTRASSRRASASLTSQSPPPHVPLHPPVVSRLRYGRAAAIGHVAVLRSSVAIDHVELSGRRLHRVNEGLE